LILKIPFSIYPGVWQANQRRKDAIPVESEARRLLERYRIILQALPTFMKFVKGLAAEAWWLYHASLHTEDPKWVATFQRHFTNLDGTGRENKLKAIKRAFAELDIQLQPPRIVNPLITFGSWKGGDRDGNPFVVAAFTNQTFIEQKLFVLTHYQTMTIQLIDKLTTSTEQFPAGAELKENLLQDRKKFPYINLNLKSWEPYRVKIRYILEKLENSIRLVKQVQQQAGTTTRPLLGQTLPGPSGYNHADELQRDINAIYESLVSHNSKAQARSMVQDIKILVDTFGLHMTSIDFRQTSEKNRSAIVEYLKADGRENEVAKLTDKNTPESEVQKILVHLLLDQQLEMNPWIVPNLSKISRDTFETMVIFADAAHTDRRAVGKFIISMCSRVSDIMIVLVMLKLVGMLESDGTKIIRCPFDVTGLLETIEDLKNGPKIFKELLSIPLIRNYICEHRQGKLTVMMGYSDSVRDGSSLASDAQIARTSLQLKQVEDDLNAGLDAHHPQRLRLVFYRGRGDTIPRGFGGSVPKSIASQLVVTREEDHTEQNRFLRRYASTSSTIDHLHMVYSAHLSRQVTPATVPAETVQKFQRYFDFFGRISYVKWTNLVQESGTGTEYFALLSKYSILPHLPRANFASRPVARDGVTYNIDSIRAIPFTMFLAQMREFTNAYYGTGTAFEKGTQWLANKGGETAVALARAYIDAISADETTPPQVYHAILSSDTRVPHLLKVIEASMQQLIGDETKFGDFIQLAKKINPDPLFSSMLKQYGSSVFVGIEALASLILETSQIRSENGALSVLQDMYRSYPPFQYSLQNKEASVLIRNKDIIDDYTESATPEEKKLLSITEEESRLTAAWVLRITGQSELELKMINRDFNSVELTILHKIQAKFLKDYQKLVAAKTAGRPSFEQQELEAAVQMSILAISQALGFAG
jgi:phosphoenolpyruvate carboxylase